MELATRQESNKGPHKPDPDITVLICQVARTFQNLFDRLAVGRHGALAFSFAGEVMRLGWETTADLYVRLILLKPT